MSRFLSSFRSQALRLSLALCALSVASCVSLTLEPRALLLQDDGAIRVQTLPCGTTTVIGPSAASNRAALDPGAIRVVTWNIHKQDDAGWERDLAQLAGGSDIVLLQEVTLEGTLRKVIEDAGLRWVMASSFLYHEDDIGVLTAARAAPLATCTQRTYEPLLGLPKSAVVSYFPLAKSDRTLAVVNVHAINFTLTLGAYHEQLEGIGSVLAAHGGPILFGGDLNTWNDARADAVEQLAKHLGLAEVPLAEDRRTLFLGKHLDHLFVRDLAVVSAETFTVTSSDHNPLAATFRLVPQDSAQAAVVRAERPSDNSSRANYPLNEEP